MVPSHCRVDTDRSSGVRSVLLTVSHDLGIFIFVFVECRPVILRITEKLLQVPSGNACISDRLGQGAKVHEACSMAGVRRRVEIRADLGVIARGSGRLSR